MNDRGILASYLLSLLPKNNFPDYSSQFKLVKDQNSNKVNDLLINKTIPVTLCDSFLTFRVTDKRFDFQGDVLKIITNKIYTIDLAKLSDKKLMFKFAKKCVSMKELWVIKVIGINLL